MIRFEPWLARWGLAPDGTAFDSLAGALLPVRRGETPAMLKLFTAEEEKRGAALMAWWDGEGAVKVLERADEALLMERAVGSLSLEAMVRGGEDEAAIAVLAQTALKLHEPRDADPPGNLVPLPRWFRELAVAANRHGGPYALSASLAQELLECPQDIVVLHGDIHHGNVLHDAHRGWLAIDPKGVIGERGYDYANMLCNPDSAAAIANLPRRLEIVCETAHLDPERQLMWLVAYLGLSAAWTLSSNGDPWQALAIHEAAVEELGLA
ncbi:MAG: aminoglycoside phosphotransferase family protein [Phenylobacterium sp.]